MKTFQNLKCFFICSKTAKLLAVVPLQNYIDWTKLKKWKIILYTENDNENLLKMH